MTDTVTLKESRKTGQFGYLLEIEELRKKEAMRRNPHADTLYNCNFDDFFSREPSRTGNSCDYFEMKGSEDDDDLAVAARRPVLEKKRTFGNLSNLFHTPHGSEGDDEEAEEEERRSRQNIKVRFSRALSSVFSSQKHADSDEEDEDDEESVSTKRYALSKLSDAARSFRFTRKVSAPLPAQ